MITFVFNSILLGVGLAMDAFSVSIANGLNEPGMRRSREFLIAGTYAFFQFLMPVIGWFCVHELVRQFRVFEKFIPWIALLLLLFTFCKRCTRYRCRPGLVLQSQKEKRGKN